MYPDTGLNCILFCSQLFFFFFLPCVCVFNFHIFSLTMQGAFAFEEEIKDSTRTRLASSKTHEYQTAKFRTAHSCAGRQ